MKKETNKEIVVVGVGPSGRWKELTIEAKDALMNADKVFFRERNLPIFDILKQKRANVTWLGYIYGIKNIKFTEVYSIIAEIVTKEAMAAQRVALALPGHPFVLESSTELVLKEARRYNLKVKIIPGMSFLETIFTELKLNPWRGFQFVNPISLVKDGKEAIRSNADALIFSPSIPLSGRPELSEIAFDKIPEVLLSIYPRDHEVFLIRYEGRPHFKNKVISCPIHRLREHRDFINNFSSIYIVGVKS